MGTDSYPVPYSSVQDAPLSETDPIAADAALDGAPVNYVQWLAHAAMDDVWAENYPGTKPTSILYRVLRQSMLREYVTQAGQAQVSSGLLDASVLREVELVNVAVETPTTTAYEIMQRPYAVGSTLTWAKYLDAVAAPPPESPLVQLADLRAALDRLALLPSAELDRLLSETLDAASHRLDAWITAISTSLLADQLPNAAAQLTNSAGDTSTTTSTDTAVLHLGAYGWAEQVAPATARATVTGAEEAAVTRLDRARAQLSLKPSAAAVQVPDPASGGYLHAPSMTQAAAGAVLRSGYLSHQATSDEPTLAIDLSSTRARTALWVLAGVRQGLSLGALTGFQFEEQLHEAGLDEYIQPFRDAYPLVGDDLTGTTASGVVTPIEQVVDGVKLRAAWQSGALAPGQSWGAGLPAAGDPAQTAIIGMLEQIDDAMSALSDVSIAESVFQIMRGNYGRVGGILDAVSRGDHPPDPDIVSTPRPGLDMTHRLMLLLAGAPPEPAAWSGVTTRPRAKAEPWLSAWVAGRLPDPATVRAQVTWTVGTQTGSASVSLRDLDIGPLDVLALADASDAPQRAELESRLLLAANPPAGADTITLTYGADHLPAGSVTFPDLLTAARAVRALVNSARPLDLAAFALPDKAPTTGAVDLAEVAGRVAAVVAALDTDLAALQAALTTLTATPDDASAKSAVVNALVTVSAYALPGRAARPGDLGSRIARSGRPDRRPAPAAPGGGHRLGGHPLRHHRRRAGGAGRRGVAAPTTHPAGRGGPAVLVRPVGHDAGRRPAGGTALVVTTQPCKGRRAAARPRGGHDPAARGGAPRRRTCPAARRGERSLARSAAGREQPAGIGPSGHRGRGGWRSGLCVALRRPAHRRVGRADPRSEHHGRRGLPLRRAERPRATGLVARGVPGRAGHVGPRAHHPDPRRDIRPGPYPWRRPGQHHRGWADPPGAVLPVQSAGGHACHHVREGAGDR